MKFRFYSGNFNRGIIFRLILYLALASSILTPVSAISSQINKSSFKSSDFDQEGTFFVSNISHEEEIFKLDKIPYIGQKWNITFSLDSDSTTSIIWKVVSGSPLFWEGISPFIMDPGDTVVNQYTSHITGDNYGSIMARYKITLVNITGSARGSYKAVLVAEGYWENIGTGQLYVSDIEAWRRSRTTTEYFPGKEIGISLIIGVILLGLYLLKRYFDQFT